MSATAGSTGRTPRERYRAQVRDEIKQIALRQLAESGPAGVSVNAIGKELGGTGPALYRYFASRDELLTEMVIDAYTDLATALKAAISNTSRRAPRRRLEAAARAYRGWALAQPHRYRLLFAPPLPGYDAHAERLVDAAQASMNLIIEILPDDHEAEPPAGALVSDLSRWATQRGAPVDATRAVRAILTWSRLHGFVSLEIAGNFASMSIDSDRLFEIELAALAR